MSLHPLQILTRRVVRRVLDSWKEHYLHMNVKSSLKVVCAPERLELRKSSNASEENVCRFLRVTSWLLPRNATTVNNYNMLNFTRCLPHHVLWNKSSNALRHSAYHGQLFRLNGRSEQRNSFTLLGTQADGCQNSGFFFRPRRIVVGAVPLSDRVSIRECEGLSRQQICNKSRGGDRRKSNASGQKARKHLKNCC